MTLATINARRLLILIFLTSFAFSTCKNKSDFAGSQQKSPRITDSDIETPPPAEVQKDLPAEVDDTTSSVPNASSKPEPTPSVDSGSGKVVIPSPPPKSIVQGSFTVWANPMHPQVRQRYYVYIRVKLPSDASSYTKYDLTGRLRGTDGYYQDINGMSGTPPYPLKIPRQWFKYDNSSKTALLVMEVPGALAGGIQDTLTIKSRLLNESQKISVQFN